MRWINLVVNLVGEPRPDDLASFVGRVSVAAGIAIQDARKRGCTDMTGMLAVWTDDFD